MILRLLVFVVIAVAGYIATLAAAFVYWDLTGASGPDYGPLLFVLFALAPATAVALGVLALRRMRGPRRAEAKRAPPGPVTTAGKNGPVQWAIALAVMLVLGALMAWLGPGPVPYIPRLAP